MNSSNQVIYIVRSLFFFLLFLFGQQVYGNTIHVCSDCEEATIATAVNRALDGDSVLVHAGNYKENGIQVSTQITIIGIDSPVINGEGTKESIFAIHADNVNIEGFVIKNIGISYTKEFAAFFVSKSKYFVLKNNVLENVFYGFIIQKSQYGLISNNSVSGNAINETNSGNGVHLWHCQHMRIESNTITGMRDGIYFEFVDESFVSQNTSRKNIRYGLHFMFSHHNEYHHNEFNANGAGVAVMFSKHIKMHHNKFIYNWGAASYGLLLKEINDAQIDHNTFEQNTIGINIDGCNRITYSNNDFIHNGWAIKFNGGCYTNIFEYNNFMNNAFDLSYNSKLNDNKFEANYWSEYSGYDLDHDGIGDVPYRPVKLFSYVVNKTPETLILLRSLFVDIINFSEKVSPVFTPDNLMDNKPIMKKIND